MVSQQRPQISIFKQVSSSEWYLSSDHRCLIFKLLALVAGGREAKSGEEQLLCRAGERMAETSLHLPLLRRPRLHEERATQVQKAYLFKVYTVL